MKMDFTEKFGYKECVWYNHKNFSACSKPFVHNQTFSTEMSNYLIIHGSKLELVEVWLISSIKGKPTQDKAHTQR